MTSLAVRNPYALAESSRWTGTLLTREEGSTAQEASSGGVLPRQTRMRTTSFRRAVTFSWSSSETTSMPLGRADATIFCGMLLPAGSSALAFVIDEPGAQEVTIARITTKGDRKEFMMTPNNEGSHFVGRDEGRKSIRARKAGRRR